MKVKSLIFFFFIILKIHSNSYGQQFMVKEMLERKSNIVLESYDYNLEYLFTNSLEDYKFNIVSEKKESDSNIKTYNIELQWNTRPAIKCGGKIILSLNGKIKDLDDSENETIGLFSFSQEFYKGMCSTFVIDKIVEKLIID